jgi:SAM-dependent methyltransferase
MKSDLVDFILCLHCQGTLHCVVEQEDTTLPWTEVVEGHLLCQACGQRYPISRGVPRMMRGPLPDEVEKTVTGFGYEWQTFDEHIQDTYMTDKTNFLDFIAPVTPDHFAGKVVLDAGCGMGRFLKLAADFGSREVIGVDLSGSVDVAYRHVRHMPNAHVIQADIMALPLKPVFDYVFSVGVLQFLEKPQAGFDRLTGLLRDQGSISVWVYAKENNGWVIRFVSPVRQYITSRLPRPLLYALSHCLGLPLYLLIRLLYKPANEGRFPFNLSRILPYNDYLYYSSRLGYGGLVSVIFDHLVPSLVTYLSQEELAAWFSSERFAGVTITSRNNMSWRAFGVCSNRFSGLPAKAATTNQEQSTS